MFEKMPYQDVVSWTAMISGYTENGFLKKVLETFNQMQFSRVKPNFVTFANILPACAIVGALEEGMDIHQRVVENCFSSNVVVVNAVYAKYGRIHKAGEIFDKMHDVNTISWKAMIGGYVIHGYNKEGFDLLKHLGYNPNNIR